MPNVKKYGLALKTISLTLIGSILTQIFAPSISYAITSGASQSEFSGFTSGDTSEMVDLSTGDFKYDIPLMTVPGADGGFPIVLSYNAGASMHDEASWVGLGWSLNPGVVNRQMRGLPDDFNGDYGDYIMKTNHIKDNMNVSLSVSSDLLSLLPEVYGFDMSLVGGVSVPFSYTMYYNTFKGLGSRVGIGAGLSTVNRELSAVNAAVSLNMTIDSNEGGEVQAGVSAGDNYTEGNAGFVYTARGGITSVNRGLTFNIPNIPRTFIRAGSNFSTASHVPDVSVPMIGGSAALKVDVEAGAFGTHMNIPITLEGGFAYMGVEKSTRIFKPYGYLYNHRRESSSTENALMDYNRDNDVAINMKLPSLPVPVSTNDIYLVKGVGGGSVFRAFRNDATLYYQPDAYNRNAGATVGLEVAAAVGFKAAADISGFYSSAYSGNWRSDFGNLHSKFKQVGNASLAQGRPSRQQAFYFKKLGETTPMENKDLYESFDKEKPSHIGITYANATEDNIDPSSMPDYEGEYPFSGMQKFKTRIANSMNGKPIPLFERLNTEKRTSLVEYRTANEINVGGTDYFRSANVLSSPITGNNYTISPSHFNFASYYIQPNHVSEFSILQTDGSRFLYGIPAYNMSQKEAIFSFVDNTYIGAGNDPTAEPLVGYWPGMTGTTHNTSRDKFIKIDEISPYTHSYLLTNILSHDYVDVTSDGPSEDDYGTYTKFNYTKHSSNFKWRIPFTPQENTAINVKGFLSVPYDNHATYTAGTKELWYLQTVETKTHIAYFIISERRDGYQSKGEHGGRAANNEKKLMKLDKIILFSKKELTKQYPVALKTVSFEYSYDLCPGVPSNDPAIASGSPHPLNPSVDANDKAGKLTLHKVIITHEASTKGRLTPYVFEYGTSPYDNPSYDYANTDRWGTYRPDYENGYKNDYNPYVIQDPIHKSVLDQQAGAWNLKTINTPSGSKINIEYESDDYAYVQDRPAQQMMQIIGMGKVDGSENKFAADTDKLPIRKNFRRIYFKPEVPISGTHTEINEQIAKYVEALPDKKLYFKVNQRLQIPKDISLSSTYVSDYVTGYTVVDDYGYITKNGEVVPYIEIPEMDHKSKNPLRAAGLQYLRYKRADLSMTAPGSDLNATNAILSSIPMFFSSMELIFGFYTWAIMRGHCEFIETSKPSFIRLCSPDGVKYGGGHRVKKITVSDGWNNLSEGTENSASYEQNFVYQKKSDDNSGYISSGVAAYEPVHGGDENALKYPYLYTPDNKFIHNDKAFFMEDPLPETYYPAPQVAYSRVLVYTSATVNVKESGSGIAVHEYYTAKDYPTISRESQPTKTDDDQTTFIPFIAGIQFRNLGYSQAFSVEVNDMHGKPKANYTYDSDNWNNTVKDVDNQSQFLTYKKYIYNQSEPASMGIPKPATWTEAYPTLRSDSPNTEQEALGLDFELFGELRESSEFSFGGGAQINGGVDPAPWAAFLAAMPYFEYSETGARVVTTNKIIYRTAVLSEVISYTEGNIERTRHISYDRETGSPVLSITTSDYDKQKTDTYEKPTYSYTIPAHWHETNMGGAYWNYRAKALLAVSGATASLHGSLLASDYFTLGDEVFCSTCPAGNRRLWVSALNGPDITLMNKTNSTLSLSGYHTFTVLRSGKRNLQAAAGASIVSTKPPYAAPSMQFIYDAFNAAAANPNTDWCAFGCPGINGIHLNLPDCSNPELIHDIEIAKGAAYSLITFKINSCGRAIAYNLSLPSNIPIQHIRFTQGPTIGSVYVTNISTNITTLVNIPSGHEADLEECFPGCLDGILDASAVEYRKEHEFDAADLPTPNLNDYASGKKGIYRVARSNAYFATRKQYTGNTPGYMHQSFAGEDGTYNRFVKFNFADGNANNIQKDYGWRWASQVPGLGISRDGKVLQTQNPLGIFTSNLYGYERNLVVATAVNANQREIAFDGFEEHPTGIYSTANDNGRLIFTSLTNTITNEKAHTGNLSMKTAQYGLFYTFSMQIPVVNPINYTSTSKLIQLAPNKKYVLSFWYSYENMDENPTFMVVTVNGTVYNTDNQSHSVDGWKRFEVVFQTPYSGNVEIAMMGVQAYVDDIRIHPFNSEMKTMVYDPVKYIPTAELDGRNYATYFVYDEEGKLVLTKKETEKGIITSSHSRSNLNR